jgi:predicted site-specific integrase-resolvase
MTARQFARRMDVNYRTALNWLNTGLVPGAEMKDSLVGAYWEIPESALKMQRPRPGPKATKRGRAT